MTEATEANARLKQEIKNNKQAEKALREKCTTLRALINENTHLILLIDLNGTVVTANGNACERYGKTLDALKGLNIFSLMPPELAAPRKKIVGTVIRSKQPVCCLEEIEGMFYNGVVYPVLDDNGVVKNYSVFVQDVTPFKLVEKSLINSEKSFRALAENANDGIILIEMDGNIVYVNNCFGRISGYNDLGLQKFSINKLIETTECEKLWERLRGRLGENPVQDRFELDLITKSGRTVPVEVTASKTIWQGQPAFMMVVRDITSQKQTEANLIREQIKLEYNVKIRTKQLMETNNALSVLARNIDHKGEETQKLTARVINSKILPIIERIQKSKDFTKHWTDFDLLKAYLKGLTSHSANEPAAISMLTNAELRVGSMIKNGFNNSEIARQLFVSLNTVKTHRRNIRRKLHIRNSKINLASYLREKMR